MKAIRLLKLLEQNEPVKYNTEFEVATEEGKVKVEGTVVGVMGLNLTKTGLSFTHIPSGMSMFNLKPEYINYILDDNFYSQLTKNTKTAKGVISNVVNFQKIKKEDSKLFMSYFVPFAEKFNEVFNKYDNKLDMTNPQFKKDMTSTINDILKSVLDKIKK